MTVENMDGKFTNQESGNFMSQNTQENVIRTADDTNEIQTPSDCHGPCCGCQECEDEWEDVSDHESEGESDYFLENELDEDQFELEVDEQDLGRALLEFELEENQRQHSFEEAKGELDVEDQQHHDLEEGELDAEVNEPDSNTVSGTDMTVNLLERLAGLAFELEMRLANVDTKEAFLKAANQRLELEAMVPNAHHMHPDRFNGYICRQLQILTNRLESVAACAGKRDAKLLCKEHLSLDSLEGEFDLEEYMLDGHPLHVFLGEHFQAQGAPLKGPARNAEEKELVHKALRSAHASLSPIFTSFIEDVPETTGQFLEAWGQMWESTLFKDAVVIELLARKHHARLDSEDERKFNLTQGNRAPPPTYLGVALKMASQKR